MSGWWPGWALAEFGDAPEPPVAGRDSYDAWFETVGA